MERCAKVRLFEQMRREYEHGVGTIVGVAKKFGVHRRMVRDALRSAMPPERKPTPRESPKLGPVRDFIDAILDADRHEPRKQRHTARRIRDRLRERYPNHEVGESTVRRYVGRRKRELGLKHAEVFIPQSYAWGDEAQVDWYESHARIGGQLTLAFKHGVATFDGGSTAQDTVRIFGHDAVPGWPDGEAVGAAAALARSAARGRELARLLDPETPVPGVTQGVLRPEIAAIAVPTTTDGHNMTGDDFVVTAGWGHFGIGDAVMPGQGRVVERPYTPEELVALGETVATLGETTFDVYLNARTLTARSNPRKFRILLTPGRRISTMALTRV